MVLIVMLTLRWSSLNDLNYWFTWTSSTHYSKFRL